MCGITGWVDWETDLTRERATLEAMARALAPRGPDADGFWLSTHAALGHRRLIVVDPTGGGQPMTRQMGDHTYVIIYNGELYNTPELRSELEARGHTFRSHSDTEVLLVSFIEWGPACLKRLNGIFAFAVWDEAGQSLFLARDRLGVKPLFYARRGSALIFGSELKSLLAHPAVPAEVDAEGLAEILVMGPSRTPGHGVFRGVSEVRPGLCLIYNRSGVRSWRYWTLESQPHQDDLETTAATVRWLVQDSVERQLVADVPVCTLLSGGLDSSALTAFAAGAFKRAGLGPLHTYSIDYAGNDRHFRPSEFQPNHDAPWAKLVSDDLGTKHHYITIDTPQLFEALGPAALARDLPGMADVDSSLLLFCREVKKEATVALSGECADEVFGGYPWFHSAEALDANTFPWMRSLGDRMRLLSPEVREWIKPEDYVAQRYWDTIAEVPRLSGEDHRQNRMREMSYLNLVWFMTTLLDRKDRMSMASGLEVRVPFCDHRLVEYVWNIPWEMKTCDNREKGILRRALAGVLPDDVLARRKSPYPKTHNPDYTAAVREGILSVLDDPSSPLLSLIDVDALRALVRSEGDAFNRPWFGQLMTGPQLFAYLIQVDAWLREYRVSIRGGTRTSNLLKTGPISYRVPISNWAPVSCRAPISCSAPGKSKSKEVPLVSKKGSIKKVFPGGNTAYGFHSFYDHIVAPNANKIFVIKGGPGVGKSTFIRKIAEEMVDRGFDVEMHHCSSDNGSLDGIYIPAIDVAIIDGTAPHVVDPRNPGAVDEIIHLGDYWDEAGMRANREQILAANREVGRLFRRAWSYLGAAKIFLDELESYYTESGALDVSRVNRASFELVHEIFGTSKPLEQKARDRHLFATAISPEGPVNYIETIVGRLQKRYILEGDDGTGKYILTKQILDAAIMRGYDVEVYHCALDPKKIDHVVIPALSVAVINNVEPHFYAPKDGDTVIDTMQFVDPVINETLAEERKAAREMYRRAFDQAIWFIGRAKKTHDYMETFYVPNMFFDKIEERRQKTFQRILELAAEREAVAD